MKPIVIFTATYNHPDQLRELYKSLLNQEKKEFSWVIVDDGSGPETEEVCREIQKEKLLDVFVMKQENSGKGRATNTAIDVLTPEVEFFAVIDDDEVLSPSAVDVIWKYAETYRDSDCVAMNFCRRDEKGGIAPAPYVDQDYFMSVQEHISRKRTTGGYIGYFVKKLGGVRFTIYKGERYIAPSTLMMKATAKNQRLLWCREIIGTTEFLEGGITKQGRRLKVKSPNGMVEYCGLMQGNGSSFFNRLKYSAMGYAYASIGGKNVQGNEYLKAFSKIAYLPGIALGAYWKKKFVK